MSINVNLTRKPRLVLGEHSAAIAALGVIRPRARSVHIATAHRLYRERRARLELFSGAISLFGEPAWDILLEIYLADTVGRAMCVGTACHSADVAQTTGLRWLIKLERIGLVIRQDDPRDGRRGLVLLTDRGRTQMERYLEQVADED